MIADVGLGMLAAQTLLHIPDPVLLHQFPALTNQVRVQGFLLFCLHRKPPGPWRNQPGRRLYLINVSSG
jgi:hypothetical protein